MNWINFNPQFAASLALALIGSAALAAKAQQPETPKVIILWSGTEAQVFCDPEVSSRSVCVNDGELETAGNSVTLMALLNSGRPEFVNEAQASGTLHRWAWGNGR